MLHTPGPLGESLHTTRVKGPKSAQGDNSPKRKETQKFRKAEWVGLDYGGPAPRPARSSAARTTRSTQVSNDSTEVSTTMW